MPKNGKKFEKAVFSFIEKLDPYATTYFDHKVRDKETGAFRQCDAWVEAKILGHLPISILISCKDHSRKLDVGKVEQFLQEIKSVGASFGVIYSSNGFTENALKKAQSNGIPACTLFEDRPSEVPEALNFSFFLFQPLYRIRGFTFKNHYFDATWRELLDIQIKPDDILVSSRLTSFIHEREEHTINNSGTTNSIPENWTDNFFITLDDGKIAGIEIICSWKFFTVEQKMILVNGSYCFNDSSFEGEILGPSIDMGSNNPGNHWNEIKIEDIDFNPPYVLAYLKKGNIESSFTEEILSKSYLK